MSVELVGDSAPLIATPDYMRTRAAGVHEELNRQSSSVALLAPTRRQEWRRFRDRWVAWYSSGPSYLWGATNDLLEGFASEAASWASELQRAGGQGPVHAPAQSEGALAATLGTLSRSPLVWAGLGLWLYSTSRRK